MRACSVTPTVAVLLTLVLLPACGTQYDSQRAARDGGDVRQLVLEQGQALDELRREQERLRAALDEMQHRSNLGGARTYGTPVAAPEAPSAYPGAAAGAPVAPLGSTSASGQPGVYSGGVSDYPSARQPAPSVAVPVPDSPPIVGSIPTAGAGVGVPEALGQPRVADFPSDTADVNSGLSDSAPSNMVISAPAAPADSAAPVAASGAVALPTVPDELTGSDYDRGVRATVNADHDAAIQSFRDFIAENPSSTYADDAQYWIGEGYFRKEQYHRAIIEFNQVATAYGSGDRAAAALLRQAEAFRVVGDRIDARLSLQKVVTRYPGTSEAQRATAMLSEIGG